MANKPQSGDQSYLRNLLGNDDYKLPDQADLARYVAGLQQLYKEFEYRNLPNPVLNDYFDRHRGRQEAAIDLTSSATSLPPYEPAMRAAATVAHAEDERMHGTLRRLVAEADTVMRHKEFVDVTVKWAKQVSPRDIDVIPADQVMELLLSITPLMSPAMLTAVKASYEAQRELHPSVTECIENCSNRDYAPSLPRDRTEIRALKQSAIDFIRLAG